MSDPVFVHHSARSWEHDTLSVCSDTLSLVPKWDHIDTATDVLTRRARLWIKEGHAWVARKVAGPGNWGVAGTRALV